MTKTDSGDGRFTRDRETIKQWADECNVIPVHETGTAEGGASAYKLHPEDTVKGTETVETLDWNEFFDGIDQHELVVVFYDDSVGRSLEVVDREQAVSRAPLDPTEVEERLLAGETITSEFTETTVVEKTITEQATIESEVIDTEVLDIQIEDAELRSREISGCDVVDKAVLDEVDQSRFEDMNRLDSGLEEELARPAAVAVDVEEEWSVTRELLERATIESRIVDMDVTESDQVESETLQSSIDIEGVQQALIESDIFDTDADMEEIAQSEAIESQFHEDDVVRTQLNQRRLVEDEITEHKVIRGELTESEVLQVETRGSTTIETAFADSDPLDMEVATENDPGMATENDPGMATEADTEPDGDERMRVTEDDEGKPLVDDEGEELGMIEKVRDGKAYVDPEPGLVDRLKTKLGWGDADEEDFSIDDENIERVTDEEVELTVSK